MKRLHLYPKHNFIQIDLKSRQNKVFLHRQTLWGLGKCASQSLNDRNTFITPFFIPDSQSSTLSVSYKKNSVVLMALKRFLCSCVILKREHHFILLDRRQTPPARFSVMKQSGEHFHCFFFVLCHKEPEWNMWDGGRCSVVCACVSIWLYQQCSGHLQTSTF